MEESICQIEIESAKTDFVARVTTSMGGAREIRSIRFDSLLNLLMFELHAEFEPDLRGEETEPDY